jgi:hypothetical protein
MITIVRVAIPLVALAAIIIFIIIMLPGFRSGDISARGYGAAAAHHWDVSCMPGCPAWEDECEPPIRVRDRCERRSGPDTTERNPPRPPATACRADQFFCWPRIRDFLWKHSWIPLAATGVALLFVLALLYLRRALPALAFAPPREASPPSPPPSPPASTSPLRSPPPPPASRVNLLLFLQIFSLIITIWLHVLQLCDRYGYSCVGNEVIRRMRERIAENLPW